MSNTQHSSNILNPMIPLSDGHWVNERVAHLIEEIRAYHDRLDVFWNPSPGPDEPEFKIVEITPDGKKHIVRIIKDQSEFNGDILADIIAGDTSRHDVLDYIDAQNKAAELLLQKEYEERMAEISDVAAHVLKSPLNTYRISKNKVIKDRGNRSR